MKYRLVKRTYMGGMVLWIIQKKFLGLFWEYLDSHGTEQPAREKLEKLRQGVPLSTEEVVS